jgi:hypothetical protein
MVLMFLWMLRWVLRRPSLRFGRGLGNLSVLRFTPRLNSRRRDGLARRFGGMLRRRRLDNMLRRRLG